MSTVRMTRTVLALIIAYAMVLGAVAGGNFAKPSDAWMTLCSQAAAMDTSGTEAPSDHKGLADCCPALCNGQPVTPVREADIARAAAFAALVWTPQQQGFATSEFSSFRLPRAPPAS